MDVNNGLLGSIVKERRELLNISQTDLAKRMGVHQSYVSDLESGKKANPTKETLWKLADALEICQEEFLIALASSEEERKAIIAEYDKTDDISKEDFELIRKLKQMGAGDRQLFEALVDALLRGKEDAN
jgi:transcriptional regulator with XRE-family HTH domain